MGFKNNLLIVILALAFILRIFGVMFNPPSLYGDELTMTLDVYSLLHTGHDQTGQPSPLTFSMGAGRPAGYIYFSLLPVALFGPTELGIRALSITSGVLLVLLVYLLGKKLASKQVGLVAALMMAVSPWDLSLSQGGFEAHFALMLVLLGILAFVYQTTHRCLLIISALAFGVAIHTYPTYKLSLPLLIPLLLWFVGWRNIITRKNWRILGVSLVLFVGLGLVAATQTLNAGSETRFTEINILADQKLKEQIIQKINIERSTSTLPENLASLFHNKASEYANVFAQNYLGNFSTDFLFLRGDGNPRHNMGNSGEMYLIELLTVFVGIVSLAGLGWRKFVFITLWLMIAALPPALVGAPHALRSSFMLPGLVLISALGVTFISTTIKKHRLVILVLIAVFITQIVIYLQRIYFVSPNLFSHFWSYPAKLASELAVDARRDYDYVILSDKVDNLEYAYPVYAQIKPELIIEQNRSRDDLNGLQLKRFENVYIGRIPDDQVEDFIGELEGKVLFVSISEDREQLSSYEVLQGRDHKDALVVVKK